MISFCVKWCQILYCLADCEVCSVHCVLRTYHGEADGPAQPTPVPVLLVLHRRRPVIHKQQRTAIVQ